MNPSLRLRAVTRRLSLAGLLALAACASAEKSPEAPQAAYGGLEATGAPPAAPPADPEAPAREEAKKEPKALPKKAGDVDETDPVRALAEAESLLDRTLGTGGHKPAPPKPAESGSPPAKEEPAADSCSIACRALASMRRSADRVCDLAPTASPDAPRCDDAKERVGRAEQRVRERCPSCAATP